MMQLDLNHVSKMGHGVDSFKGYHMKNYNRQ